MTTKPGDLWLCETGNALPLSPMHIRPLTSAGARPGGGADTAALCGRKPSWDVRAFDPGRDLDPAWTCRSCLTVLQERAPAVSAPPVVGIPALGRPKALPVMRRPWRSHRR